MMKKIIYSVFAFFVSLLAIGQQPDAGFKSQSNDDFARTIANDSIQLVDVRTGSEFESGHIPGAINIDVKSPDFGQMAEGLDKSRPVAVYCRSGARSKMAAKILVSQGFVVYELNGGIMNWNGETTR